MKNFNIGKAKLNNLLDDLFGDPNLTDDEFIFHSQVLAEQECYLIADGYLTQDQILEIEEAWTRPLVA